MHWHIQLLAIQSSPLNLLPQVGQVVDVTGLSGRLLARPIAAAEVDLRVEEAA